MEIVFWVALAILAYTYIGYPLALWLLGRMFGQTPRQRNITPRLTLLISAYNEEELLAEKLENSLALDYPRENLEILVASESTDGTNAIVERYAQRGVKLRAFSPRRGKSATLYASVPQTTGEIIVFSDANAFYRPDALKKLARNFADPRIGCVSGRLEYFHEGQASAAANESLYWRYETWLKRLESRRFALLGANGSIFALRRELYFPLSETRGDDFELPIRVLLWGRGVVLEPEAVSRERMSETTHAEFCRRIRIVAWNARSAVLLFREAFYSGSFFTCFQLVSHKVARWLAMLFLVLTLASSFMLAGAFYRTALVLQLVFYGMVAAGWVLEMAKGTGAKLLRAPYYFFALQAAALFGICRSLMYPPSTTWEKVR